MNYSYKFKPGDRVIQTGHPRKDVHSWCNPRFKDRIGVVIYNDSLVGADFNLVGVDFGPQYNDCHNLAGRITTNSGFNFCDYDLELIKDKEYDELFI